MYSKIMIPTDSNEAHLPTPRFGQYFTHAHNHDTINDTVTIDHYRK